MYELDERCKRIEGLSFVQLAALTGFLIPVQHSQRKGWTGQAVEKALGSTAGNRAVPDFEQLGIELKTIPLNEKGLPAESTFITSIDLLTVHQQQWLNSSCRHKLQTVLWVPVEGVTTIPFEQRRVGRPFIWSPDVQDEAILARDWEELSSMIGTGRLEEIHAGMGEYLQVRPKAANARSLCHGYDAEANRILTLPRGFYLRSRFTAGLLSDN